MTIRIPRTSPVHYLDAGEWQVYCPDPLCGWAAPRNHVGGGRFGCELCHGPLRVAEVTLKSERSDRPYLPIDISTEDDTDA